MIWACSVVTVSKVLRNHSDISTETRKRILQRTKELNYQPNPAARTVVTEDSVRSENTGVPIIREMTVATR
jgi:DNA-binding LacI/PurR family transcriptional regulator